MSKFSDMREAVNEAREVISSADAFAESMAEMIVGRLRHIDSSWVLERLKRELRDYNITTGTWKQPGGGK